ncbi:MAG: enoyl-CoA hydratase/isomerase family protein [Pseudomonadota bacterium]
MEDWLEREEAPEGVTVVRMRHGEQNRISGPFCDALRALLEDLARDDGVRAVVMTGHGRFFCNGLDLAWAGGRPREEVVAFMDGLSGLLRDTALFPKPIIGAINGHGFGMGAIWASGFDARVVLADRGWVCFPMFEYDLPLTPGMIAYCEHGLGTTTFREMAWTGRRYSAPMAVAVGWAAAAVDEATLMEEAQGWAALLGGKGRTAFSLTKQAWARPVVEAIDTLDPAANRAYPEVPTG